MTLHHRDTAPAEHRRRAHTRDPEDGDDFGHRPLSNWGSGDLPAPFATGDLLWLDQPYNDKRMRPELGDPGWYVVVYSTSIDEGDAWYFRVERIGDPLRCSGRMHVVHADRAEMGQGGDLDYMAPFELVETADPEGLAERERLLADGWAYVRPPRCRTCGQRLPNGGVA